MIAGLVQERHNCIAKALEVLAQTNQNDAHISALCLTCFVLLGIVIGIGTNT